MGEGGQVQVNIIGALDLHHVFQVLKRYIGTQVKGGNTLLTQQVIYIEEAKLMKLAFRQKKDKQRRIIIGKRNPINGVNNFLANDVGGNVLLHRAEAVGLPENANPFQECED